MREWSHDEHHNQGIWHCYFAPLINLLGKKGMQTTQIFFMSYLINIIINNITTRIIFSPRNFWMTVFMYLINIYNGMHDLLVYFICVYIWNKYITFKFIWAKFEQATRNLTLACLEFWASQNRALNQIEQFVTTGTEDERLSWQSVDTWRKRYRTFNW